MLRWLGFFMGMALLLPLQAEADCLGPCSSELCWPIVDKGEPWALVEVELVEAGTWAVVEVHGGPLASEVARGQTFPADLSAERALLVVNDRSSVQAALRIDDADRVTCLGAMGEAPLAATIEAALSSNCYGRTAAVGLADGESVDDDPGSGCSGSGGGGPPWIGALVVLLGLGTSVSRRRSTSGCRGRRARSS